MKHIFAIGIIFQATLAHADQRQIIQDTVQNHILPRYEALKETTTALSETAMMDCLPESEPLRAAYNEAFDDWIAVSHLRFGPSETDDRAFALAFWPDPRGSTPKTLGRLLSNSDEAGLNVEDFSDVSIAARGFYAMEFLLYEDALRDVGEEDYRCSLIQTAAADIAESANAIADDWEVDFSETLLSPSGLFKNDQEVIQELFKALTLGFQFTSESRIGRPLADLDRPRPRRAEAWRSGRSSRNIEVSIATLADLAERLSADRTDLQPRLADRFGHCWKLCDRPAPLKQSSSDNAR
ncbi:hypothetical protein SAMN05444003_3073 [Cognatiyoonia sediminum]|uniref:Imelysin-like domain-containing protein n=1 Tax=Cognatiyoonia sediminum TaxID=1508389 RepID=A0A1M5SS91_9RHOB|nr:imelysin family protein [Cognatiyoonia sediminum]SHH41330.1 hypothetical protein SAMN05444003_3073 [Cognatiyoonia sediminum]